MIKASVLLIYILVWMFTAPFFAAHFAFDYAEKTMSPATADRNSFATQGMMAGALWPLFIGKLFSR